MFCTIHIVYECINIHNSEITPRPLVKKVLGETFL